MHHEVWYYWIFEFFYWHQSFDPRIFLVLLGSFLLIVLVYQTESYYHILLYIIWKILIFWSLYIMHRTSSLLSLCYKISFEPHQSYPISFFPSFHNPSNFEVPKPGRSTCDRFSIMNRNSIYNPPLQVFPCWY